MGQGSLDILLTTEIRREGAWVIISLSLVGCINCWDFFSRVSGGRERIGC